MSTSGKGFDSDTVTQYKADARLSIKFEQTGKYFNYSRSVQSELEVSSEELTTYLDKIERSGFIQSFGCMLTVERFTYKTLAFSENIFDMLGLSNLEELQEQEAMSLMGMDARILFTPDSRVPLDRAMRNMDITLWNPICVHSRGNNNKFYAMLNRTNVGIIIDLEPSHPLLHTATLQAQNLASNAITKLQIMTSGDIGVLCDTVVEVVQKLTGYDRVMMYKFHEDNHGEVVSEFRKPELEPFVGVHFPAIDIPQIARFIFMQCRIRMIRDCRAPVVRVIQSEALGEPISLVNSVLRASHECHVEYMSNMGSIASLVMAICVRNEGEAMKLWGLVVCHHTSPRYAPIHVRYACQLLVQALSLKLQLVLQTEAHNTEKNAIRVQTLLCDMLLRGAPPAIMNQSPNIMDLVKCDGAALYYGGKCWFLGVTPTESQLQDIVNWLLNVLDELSIGLSTDSLVESGYPGAGVLGDAVCGMATARVTALDFIFWFRSHTAKELKWGGAMHEDGGRMHLRTSFKVFLDKVKQKSLPWEAGEINTIYSLQLLMKDYLKKIEEAGSSQENRVQV